MKNVRYNLYVIYNSRRRHLNVVEGSLDQRSCLDYFYVDPDVFGYAHIQISIYVDPDPSTQSIT